MAERIFPLFLQSATAVAVALGVAACGGGSSGNSSAATSPSTSTYALSAAVSGLSASGLVLAVNGTTVSAASGATSVTLSPGLGAGTGYTVAIITQPENETCTVGNGTGTMPAAAVTDVTVKCSTNTFVVGGTVSGLGASTGLVLLDNGGDATTVPANANRFAMNTSLVAGAAYDVTIKSNPAWRQCSVADGSGTVGSDDITSISVSCSLMDKVLYSFAGGSDGAEPLGTLLQAKDGNFYGVTSSGGAYGGGTLFEYDPATGTETVLYSFGNGSGSNPVGSLIQATDGNLYGITASGGTSGVGAIFEYNTTTRAETETYSFTQSPGPGSPLGGLVQAADGNFYGLSTGGANGLGAVYEYNPTGATATVLYSFSTSFLGVTGNLLQVGGNFYGVSVGMNSSLLFEYDPTTGTLTKLHAFGSVPADGYMPVGDLIQAGDGKLYGLTTSGGMSNSGSLYEYDPSTQTYTVLHSFVSYATDAAQPMGGLLEASDGNLYGMAQAAGAYGGGGVFEYNLKSHSESLIYSFAGSPDGSGPQGGLIQGSDGVLYGMTYDGGASSVGTIFALAVQ